jgi:putative transcriptional regulator
MGGFPMTCEFRYGKADERPPYQYKMSGLDDVYLLSGYDTVDTEHGPGVVIQNMDGLHRAIGEYLARHKKALSGKEIRFLRHEMDITQGLLGNILRVTDQTVARWEKEQVLIPGPEELLLRVTYLLHLSQKVDVRELAEALSNLDSGNQRHLFAETEKGWMAIAA